jgi:hypothetical protein
MTNHGAFYRRIEWERLMRRWRRKEQCSSDRKVVLFRLLETVQERLYSRARISSGIDHLRGTCGSAQCAIRRARCHDNSQVQLGKRLNSALVGPIPPLPQTQPAKHTRDGSVHVP